MNKIKFGIVGYGKMGKIREESILNSKTATVIAICDNSNFENIDDSVIRCDSYDELLKMDIDAVIVSAYVSVAALRHAA